MQSESFVRVAAAQPLSGFRVRVRFSNGEEQTVDLEPYLRGEIFDPIQRDPAIFRELTVDSELGTIVWPNGADIDPDVLYGTFEPAWRTEAVGDEGPRTVGRDRR